MPFGTELRHGEVRQRNGRVRVVWRFRPVEEVTRTFVLNYRVKGVVREESGADLLVWRATPGEHALPSDQHAAVRASGSAPIAEPGVTTRKTGASRSSARQYGRGQRRADRDERLDRYGASGLPAASVLATPPLWQQRAARIQAQSLNWIAGAATVVAAGFLLMIAWRQGYDGRRLPKRRGLLRRPPRRSQPGARRRRGRERTGRHSSTRWRRCSRWPIAARSRSRKSRAGCSGSA